MHNCFWSFCYIFLCCFPFAAYAQTVAFNRDVLPILSDKCFACHGPDAASKKIPFRLDSEAAAKADLKGHHAIVAGDIEKSELVHRITTDRKSSKMPPVYSGLTLSDREIQVLTTWIAQGAKWQQHWSFIPPERSAIPEVKTPGWVKNPIDSFILARLEKEGLSPSPEVNREGLIRRVTLDLTGLPPTLAEIDSYLNNHSANAYEQVVDRLLASPRYGERMAERWLDAARYADSNGYQYDAERSMWRWRDWVIDSFNRNQPYDRFALEQLAGDLLPNATLDQKVATGFNRNHRANTEDGIIPEEYAVEYVVDRVETTSTAFMGVTLGCARCHNHKYDPFTQKEFYQVFSYFNNIPEMGRAMKYGNSPPMIADPTADQRAQDQKLTDRMGVYESFLKQNDRKIAKSQAVWEHSLQSQKPLFWQPANDLEVAFPMEDASGPKTVGDPLRFSPGRIGNAACFDGTTFLDAGDKAGFDIEDRFTISAWVYGDAVPEGSLVSRMVDEPKGKGFGIHLVQGHVHVNLTSTWADDAIRVDTEEAIAAGRWTNILITYSGSRMAEGVHVYLDGRLAKLKVELDTLYRPFRNAGKPVHDPLRIGGGWGAEHRFRGRMDEVRIYHNVLSPEEIASLAFGESLTAMAAKDPATRSESEKYQLRRSFLETASAPEIRNTWTALAALSEKKQTFERSFPTVMVMEEQPKRKDSFVLVRGAYNVHGDKVEPGVPAVLSPLPAGAPANRLGFAEWLIDKKNPLLARVTVNRFWQMYFGTGIVKTVEDFGRQGEWPSHPELLDWLATEFVRTGWDVKAMQKLIVMSAAYRQSSEVSPPLQQRDPDNRLIARGPRYRLPAETIHDQALAASGLLVEKLGGPSVKPYQPAGLWKEISMQDMDYTQGKGADLYRRSLYTFWKRTVAPPMQSNFDSALRESCVVRESRTNTPLQALNLMNDVTYLEAGRFLGQRMMKEGGPNVASRLRYGFRLVTGRVPDEKEMELLSGNLQFHRNYFSDRPKEAALYLQQGDSKPDPALKPAELAAYAELGNMLLNLDEAITKE